MKEMHTMRQIPKKLTGLFHLTLFLLTSEAVAVTRTIQMAKLERTTALDNNTCSTGDVLMSTSVRDVSMCAFLCMEDDKCQTMFYNQHEEKCNGCSAIYSVGRLPSPSPGFIHFQKKRESCDAGWTNFQGSCYKLSPQGNFTDGVNYCETNNAHAVYIETSEENEFLKTFLPNDASLFWYIGMTDSVQSGVWRYYGTNQLVDFLDFHPTEPTDGNGNGNIEQCVMFHSAFNYQWIDHSCTIITKSICEKTL